MWSSGAFIFPPQGVYYQHMVQTGMTPSPYATQFAQNGEAAGPLKAAEAGKEAPVVPGPPFSPPPATLPLNGIEQPSVTIKEQRPPFTETVTVSTLLLICLHRIFIHL
ncbi:uncharacterized protein LOC129005832 [Macrosteles quadrilineatus]|uniref:uncharacterized protein LOC129005832 n=1 Tax=Macrosteles quadrilineatus TaxID=74068 RepID=UPI0023E2EC17|nr:uncharacterized protein LOC129005832 [Macrosteles quadrilineatus]